MANVIPAPKSLWMAYLTRVRWLNTGCLNSLALSHMPCSWPMLRYVSYKRGASSCSKPTQIGALVAHIILFWGGDTVRAFKAAKRGVFDDPHHAHMAKHYKEAPWWWYMMVLVISFVLGLIVVIKENVTLPVWAYVIALLLGTIVSPLVCLHQSKFFRSSWFNLILEYPLVCSLWQRDCDEQPFQGHRWTIASRTSHWEHVLCCMVS
jgi:hypothetical protein